jgi:carbon dioxide concentrating mechanism protein CcmM
VSRATTSRCSRSPSRETPREPQANALPRKEEAQAEFQRAVLEVNREFAEQSIRRFERDGYRSVVGVTASPRTSFNRGLSPTVGRRFTREPFARVTGDVRLGDDVTIGQRTSIRADEGAPIAIGDRADIEDRVTFHALRGTSIRIGDRLDTEDSVVFHGPPWSETPSRSATTPCCSAPRWATA